MEYIRNPMFTAEFDGDKIYIMGMEKSYKIGSKESIAVIRDVMNRYMDKTDVNKMLDSIKKDEDRCTAEGFISFAVEAGILIPYGSFKKKVDSFSDFYQLCNWHTDQRADKKVCVLYESGLRKCLFSVRPLFKECNAVFVELDDITNAKEQIEQILTSPYDLFVVFTIGKKSELLKNTNELCFKIGQSWLPVYLDKVTATIGPIIIPHVTPCFECAEKRVALHYLQRGIKNNGERYTINPELYPDSVFTSIAFLAMHNISLFLLNELNSPLTGTVMHLNVLNFSSQRYRILYFPGCEVCDED